MPPPPLDVIQKEVSNVFVSPIAWFDSLFFTRRDEVETNQSYLRLIFGPEWINGEGVQLRKAIRVRIRVPALQNRLRILFSDDDENDVDPSVADKAEVQNPRSRFAPVNPNARISGVDTANHTRAGLGYQLVRLIKTDVDVETALRSHTRGELSVRARQGLPEAYGVTSKLILTGFWLQGTGFGSTGQMNMERLFSKNAVVHFDNAVTQIHNVNGVVFDGRLSAELKVSKRAGLSPGIGSRAETRPRWRTTQYYTSVVYRQQFFRDWLFYELEPGESWDRDANGVFPPSPFVAFRIEAQFREEPGR